MKGQVFGASLPHISKYIQHLIIRRHFNMGQCVQRSEQDRQFEQMLSEISIRQNGQIRKKHPSFVKLQINHFPPIFKNITKALENIKQQEQKDLEEASAIYPQTLDSSQNLTLKQKYLQCLRNGSYKQIAEIQTKKVYKLYNGAIFQGEFNNEEILGLGRIISSDDMYIQTEFVKGCPSKYTKIIKKNGEYFCGYIEEMNPLISKLSGNAYGTIKEGTLKYTGYLQYNKPHGEGMQVSDQHIFMGHYEKGKKISGKLTWNLLQKYVNYYEGTFKDSKFDGKGELMENNDHYYGEFKQDKKQGQGVLKYENGDIYEGGFKNGKKHGKGKLTRSCGGDDFEMKVEGQWEEDKFIS